MFLILYSMFRSVNFALQFQPLGDDDMEGLDFELDDDDPDGDDDGPGGKKKGKKGEEKTGEVVSLDQFRKK